MTLILTFHEFGEYANSQRSREQLLIDTEKGIKIWSQLVDLFKGKGYDNLFFGLYDEPRAKSDETWDYFNKLAMSKLRPLDLDRYWIIGSNRYMSVKGFEGLTPIPNDNKILYAFHFYDPYIFTHQGAPWDKNNTYLTGLPYPYMETEMPPMTERVRSDKDMNYNYLHYSEFANKAYLNNLVKIAHDWSIKNKVPIICTETGTFDKIAEKYRNNYIKDIADILKSYNIPMVVWELDRNFKIYDSQKQPLTSIQDWIQSYKKE